MYNQIREDTLFLMFYASVAMLALIACCYLLFRRANAIAPDVTPSVRLRRWTAIFFAAIALCHLWYLPMYFLTSPDEVMLGSLIAGWLDCMTVIPLMIIILLTMLQDRRRPLWPSSDPRFFGPASYHEDDYPFFYNNIKENVAKRVAAYLENDN